MLGRLCGQLTAAVTDSIAGVGPPCLAAGAP
jgi:hypothetical protein